MFNSNYGIIKCSSDLRCFTEYQVCLHLRYEIVVNLTPSRTEETLKIVITAIAIMAIIRVALKLNRDILKELEGMGL